MEKSLDNSCFTCSIGQACSSKLSGLKLTNAEYERLFACHTKSLEVQQKDQFYIVSSKAGDPCPYWTNDRCTIYYNRPIECCLFPYTIGMIHRNHRSVLLSFHARTHCPKKKELLMPKAKAKEMVLSFARNAFGKDFIVRIEYENPHIRFKYNAKRLMKKIKSYHR